MKGVADLTTVVPVRIKYHVVGQMSKTGTRRKRDGNNRTGELRPLLFAENWRRKRHIHFRPFLTHAHVRQELINA